MYFLKKYSSDCIHKKKYSDLIYVCRSVVDLSNGTVDVFPVIYIQHLCHYTP